MFLAINELIKEKSRFVLIVFVVILVSYLTFFLTALAFGLATSYTQGINKWNASGILLQEDANDNISRSLLVKDTYERFVDSDTAVLGVGSATIDNNQPIDVFLFGINLNEFLSPNITEGRAANGDNEIVASDELTQSGIMLGQKIYFKGLDKEYEIVGFTDKATFQTTPIVYMGVGSWRGAVSELAGMIGMKDDTTISALITRGEVSQSDYVNTNMSWHSIGEYSKQLPGYNAQVLTFGTMIAFLIGISSFVLAIFMYILTLQKKSIFGVLKAEGVPSGYIAWSVIIQTVLISGAGMLVGLVLTLVSGLFLQGKMPFLVQPLFFVIISASFLVFAAIGGVASVRAVTKIDPVEAIG